MTRPPLTPLSLDEPISRACRACGTLYKTRYRTKKHCDVCARLRKREQTRGARKRR